MIHLLRLLAVEFDHAWNVSFCQATALTNHLFIYKLIVYKTCKFILYILFACLYISNFTVWGIIIVFTFSGGYLFLAVSISLFSCHAKSSLPLHTKCYLLKHEKSSGTEIQLNQLDISFMSNTFCEFLEFYK